MAYSRYTLSGNLFFFFFLRRFGNESKQFMLIMTNRHGTVLERNAWTLQVQSERERERGSVRKNKCLHLLILSPGAPNPTCVSKRREQTPKNKPLESNPVHYQLLPHGKKIKNHKEKKKIKKGEKCVCVCVQCVVRPGVCMCRALLKCLRFMLDIPHGVTSPGRGGRGEALPVNGHGLLKV